MVPAMVYFLKTDIKTAVGTSLVVIVPTALMGVWKHHHPRQRFLGRCGVVDSDGDAGGFLGAALDDRSTPNTLKRHIGGFIVLVGLRLLLFK